MQAPQQPRAGMPFTGIATFARAPYVPPEVLQPGQADFAVIGVPFDAAVGFRPGQRLAPRAIRDLSTRYALPWGPDNPGYWDIQDDRWYLKGCRLVDLGDADPLYTDLEHLDRSVAALVGAALRAGAVPVVLGGDHSITYPVLRAYGELLQAAAGPGPAARFGGEGGGQGSGGGRLHVLQIDAHLDFSADVAGFLRSNSSPFRRAAELPYVGTITVIGVRGIRTSPEAYAAAVRRGNRIVTMGEWRAAWARRAAIPAGVGPSGGPHPGTAADSGAGARVGGATGSGAGAGPAGGTGSHGRTSPGGGGPAGSRLGWPPAPGDDANPLVPFLAAIPPGEPLYISLDIDGLDPAVAPGTSSPEPGGLTYEEVREILRLAASRARVVGIDIVEVNPYLDPAGMTALLAARLAIEAMAFSHGALASPGS
ncbi:hypothetical protein DYI95_003135 [Thermaerobacter sp. PB12/4term]|uniref:arginase family protein n=1 Tax=Thermaerobacter sp. PB12/4term TaxID=2293838 RepID=UPI000E32A5C6|nr:arginase family protein [Thermaerobacter sp. PB12/4term]QIA26652.1 hypothetical protein DYI95_003135 [Thermaerobacter sp. PB12/4term]